MNLRIILLLIALKGFIFVPLVAQSFSASDSIHFRNKEKKANAYFRQLAYVKAIKAYENLQEKGYQTDSLIRNLAFSCFKTGDTRKSEDLLRPLIGSSHYLPSDLYVYIQSLKYNRKYEEADLWMDKYVKENTTDSRGPMQQASAPFVKKLTEIERYKVEDASFNSENSDFGAVEYGGDILFSSSRNNQAIIRFEDAWKGAPYFALYRVKNADASVVNARFFARKFNTVYNDGPVCFNAAGNEIFVTRNNYRNRVPRQGKEGINNLKILHATKTAAGSWSSLKELPFDNNDFSCGHPSLSPDGKTLYFASDMPGGTGGTDLYYATRSDSGWSRPVNMGRSINTEGDEMFPFIHSNGCLYFSSNGHQGMGGLDIFIAHKNPDGNYTVKNMGYPLNSEADDFSIYLRTDGKSGYFSSNREGGRGDDDIYRLLVTNPILFGTNLEVAVIDSLTSEPLKMANIELLDDQGKVLQKTDSQNSTALNFQIEPNQKYSIHAACDTYNPKTLSVNTTSSGNETIRMNVPLSKPAEYGIFGNVFIKGTQEIVPDIQVKVYDKNDHLYSETTTRGTADFRMKLEPNTDYQIVFSKPSFLTKRVYYSTKNRKATYVNINEFVEVAVQKLELNAIIEIPNIYYDLAKWNIRSDAALELEKVVQFLNDNPTIRVELGSHTDSRGSDQSNLILSQKRAQSAVDFIVKKGISLDRIVARGYGETKLKNRCANGVQCTEEEHQQNRRTEIRITGF